MAESFYTLTADSGSTKTTWRLAPNNGSQTPVYLHTQGISPIHQSPEEIETILREELLSKLQDSNSPLTTHPSPITTIAFYGSGCLPEMCPMVKQVLRHVFPDVQNITVDSDLMGAAIALCGHDEGIACILGTGANSGLYDGEKIVKHTPPMGYILGDEGSGASLGKALLNMLYKGHLRAELREAFEHEMQLSYSDVICRVYREPMAARFLASLSPFILRHIDDDGLRQMVITCFRSFFRLHIAPYGRPDLPVCFVGSIAYHYQELLSEAATAEGFTLGHILKEPLA